MCEDTGSRAAAQAANSAPREVIGPAVDPIALLPVDEVVVTTLVDNSYDLLAPALGAATPAGLEALTTVEDAHFTTGETRVGLVAEHGFAALVTVRRGATRHTLLFDTGISPYGLSVNMERLEVDAAAIEAVVVSHNHFDHTGGFTGLSALRGRAGVPLVVHPLVWTQRRFAPPGDEPVLLPRLSRRSLEAEGFEVYQRRQPSVALGGCILITGEVDRTTDFERGMPFHEIAAPGGWEPDPLILDDQAVVVHVRDRGLVVVTGCGHAGAVNIVRHATRLTGVDRVVGLFGGLHLNGPAFEPIIPPTLAALQALDLDVLVPGHCTGWRAQLALANGLPQAFLPGSVGTSYTVATAA